MRRVARATSGAQMAGGSTVSGDGAVPSEERRGAEREEDRSGQHNQGGRAELC